MQASASLKKKAVLISGASTGIGLDCVQQLSKAGYKVFAGVRKTADFERLKNASPESSGVWVEPVYLDVCDSDSIEQALQQIQTTLNQLELTGLYGLVNNAGIVMPGPLGFMPMAHFIEQCEVNVYGQLRLTQACLPLLRANAESSLGRAKMISKIIMMSSIAGRTTMPFLGAYSASKHALEAMSNALRYELHPLGISVSLIEPGVIQTTLWEKTYTETQTRLSAYPEEIHSIYGRTLRYMLDEKPFPPVKGLSVSHVSSVVLKVLNTDSPKSRYVVGNDAKLRLLMNLLPDSWMDALLRKLLRLN